MRKTTILTAGFFVGGLVITLGITFAIGGFDQSRSKRPNPLIYEVPEDHIYWQTWREDWQPLPAKVTRAVVDSETSTELNIAINTVYKGEYGPATACGVIMGQSEETFWECVPVPIQPGENASILRFRLLPDAPEAICSNQLSINMQNSAGHIFYVEQFAFDKTWGQSVNGFFAKLFGNTKVCPDPTE